jgi:hypothetical protein
LPQYNKKEHPYKVFSFCKRNSIKNGSTANHSGLGYQNPDRKNQPNLDFAKHSLQSTALSSRGLKGTRASFPHSLQTVTKYSLSPLAACLRASRQLLQRWGSFLKPRSA